MAAPTTLTSSSLATTTRSIMTTNPLSRRAQLRLADPASAGAGAAALFTRRLLLRSCHQRHPPVAARRPPRRRPCPPVRNRVHQSRRAALLVVAVRRRRVPQRSGSSSGCLRRSSPLPSLGRLPIRHPTPPAQPPAATASANDARGLACFRKAAAVPRSRRAWADHLLRACPVSHPSRSPACLLAR
jgi:hypothetical protein